MIDREKVIKGLECCAVGCRSGCPYSDIDDCESMLCADALALLKAQNLTVEPKLLELDYKTKAWLDEMDAVDALGNIADICMDFDGYRTANCLGELINEVRTYAKYCANKLLKTQKPICKCDMWFCGRCKTALAKTWMFCPKCGQAVKWESANVGGSAMTREEAIEILEEVKVMDDSMYAYNDSYLAALDMAIEALKAQHDYEASVEAAQYCERYEPTYNPEDGSM